MANPNQALIDRFMKEVKKEGILESRSKLFLLREDLLAQLDQAINSFASDAAPAIIRTQDVVLEMRDPGSGCIFRRELPLEVEENSNGLKLTGESLSGQSADIVFYSQIGAGRINDLMGGGPDVDRCGTHGGPDHSHE